MEPLGPKEALRRLRSLNGWAIHGKKLVKEFKFEDFAQALAFVNKVGGIAARLDHHPDVQLTYGRVLLEITTHSAGRLTEMDFKLAEAIDGI